MPAPSTESSTTSTGLERALAQALQALARDLLYPSESDFPYKAFVAPLAKELPLTPETFRDAARIGRRYKVTVRSGDEFFEHHIHPVDGDDDDVPRYVLLKNVMEATLSDLSWIKVGGENVVRVRVYVFGRLEGANLAGLSSVSIET